MGLMDLELVRERVAGDGSAVRLFADDDRTVGAVYVAGEVRACGPFGFVLGIYNEEG